MCRRALIGMPVLVSWKARVVSWVVATGGALTSGNVGRLPIKTDSRHRTTRGAPTLGWVEGGHRLVGEAGVVALEEGVDLVEL